MKPSASSPTRKRRPVAETRSPARRFAVPVCGRRLAVVVLLTLGAATTAAEEAEPIGTVTAVRGRVELFRADTPPVRMKLKDPIFLHDRIRTGRRGRVQIIFSDDTILNMGRNTELTINEYLFAPSDGKGAMRLDIREGVFRIMGGAIMRIAPENFKAETPTSTIGIRGSYLAAETSADTTWLVLIATGGAGIYAENRWGRTDLEIPGEGTRIDAGRPPSPPRPMAELVSRLLDETRVGGGAGAPGGRGGAESTWPPAGEEGGAKEPGNGVPNGFEGGFNFEDPDTPADPHERIPGYEPTYKTRTDAEEEVDRPPPTPPAPTPAVALRSGFATGWDATAGWSLMNSIPEDFQATVSVAPDGTLETVIGGGMAVGVFANGSTTPRERAESPEGPQQSPPLSFGFANGRITGNEAVRVVDSRIETNGEPPGAAPDYLTWGYWEMRIADPNDPTETHQVGGAWQATTLARTAVETMKNVFLGRNLVGHYRGDAHCVRNGVDRFDGLSAFHFNFQDRTFDGNLDFRPAGGPAMTFDGSVDAAGFRGRVNTVSGANTVGASPIHGAFFGPAAEAVGAAFSAHTNTDHYTGVAGAAFTHSEPATPPRRRK